MQQRRIRIESDGTAAGTRVVDAATGEPIDGVTSVVITASTGYPPEAVVAFEGVEITLYVDAKVATGKVINLHGKQ